MDNQLKIGFIVKGLQTYYTHIEPFVKENVNTNHNIYILHLDKFYGTIDAKIENKNIELIDLMNIKNYYSLFRKLSLNAVVFLNPGNLFDIFLILILKELKIKSIYLQHGVKANSNQNPNYEIQNIKESIIKYVFFLSRIIINFIYSRNWSFYIITIIKRIFYLIFFRKNIDVNNIGMPSFHCDYAFVYTKDDALKLEKRINFNTKDIFIMGYPFIEPSFEFKTKFVKSRYILYISSGLRQASVINITDEQERKMYNQLNNAALQNGYNLIIKLHPKEDVVKILKYFPDKSNIEVIHLGNIANLVIKADIIVGDFSTALLYGIKYYKPIFLLKYEYYSHFPFDLTLFNIGIKVNITDFSDLLTDLSNTNINRKAYDDFLEMHCCKKDKSFYLNVLNMIQAINNNIC